MAVLNIKCCSQRRAVITRGRLHEHAAKQPAATHYSIIGAIERQPARHAQILEAGFCGEMLKHVQLHRLQYRLNSRRQILEALVHLTFRSARWPKAFMQLRQDAGVGFLVCNGNIFPEDGNRISSIVLEPDEFHHLAEVFAAVSERCKAHHFVFVHVEVESEVQCEHAVEHAQ